MSNLLGAVLLGAALSWSNLAGSLQRSPHGDGQARAGVVGGGAASAAPRPPGGLRQRGGHQVRGPLPQRRRVGRRPRGGDRVRPPLHRRGLLPQRRPALHRRRRVVPLEARRRRGPAHRAPQVGRRPGHRAALGQHPRQGTVVVTRSGTFSSDPPAAPRLRILPAAPDRRRAVQQPPDVRGARVGLRQARLRRAGDEHLHVGQPLHGAPPRRRARARCVPHPAGDQAAGLRGLRQRRNGGAVGDLQDPDALLRTTTSLAAVGAL
ncbi:hypothetical protein GQ55_5G514700 [Panicum hallii var. hallii]|uniref:Uncharacterized protein n=1 Tax=Panicum hallii var. hallii TaxID=1504633 RepID=A0A2T7DSF8_9POAL|nr:hypothetical protein GQ55_5G514700 [Panicum hallii var. hallii]